MSGESQESDDLKSYHIDSTYIPQSLIPQSGGKEEGAKIGISIGAGYVWAVYGLALASSAIYPAVAGYIWFVSGVTYSLGLMWLAERYPPKHLAWGTLGLNPGWALLLVFAIHDLSDVLHTNDEAVGWTLLGTSFAMYFWMEGSLLSLGVWKHGFMLQEEDSPKWWVYELPPRIGQIIVGVSESAISSFFFLMGIAISRRILGLLESFWPIPLAGSLVGLTWVVSRSRGRRVRRPGLG